MSPHRRPLPPTARVRALVAQAQSRGRQANLSRRSFLVAALGTAGQPPCWPPAARGRRRPAARPPRTSPGVTRRSGGPTGRSNLDQDDDGTSYPSLQAFEKASGLSVEYAEDIDDNDAFYGKVSGQLKNGQDIGYDIVTLTDWMAARMIRLGYTQTLDKARIPNASNILSNLANVDFDPGRTHSLTWQSGSPAWRGQGEGAGGLHSLSDLWAPELADGWRSSARCGTPSA